MQAWPFSAKARRELRGPLGWGLGNSLKRMMAQLYSMVGHDQRRPCELWHDHGTVGQAIILRGERAWRTGLEKESLSTFHENSWS